MLSKFEAKLYALGYISDFFGLNYTKSHLQNACESYPSNEIDEIEYEYFIAFEGNEQTNKWTVFARVLVNRETKECHFLDYITPEGKRMQNPIKPISFA